MKIVYIHSNFMPSRAANGVQVSKMCQTFSDLGHDVTLITPHAGWRGTPPSRKSFNEAYGIKANFPVRSVAKPKGKGGGFLFSAFAAIEARKLRPDIVYSRCIRSSYLAALLGMNVVFEMHSARTGFSRTGGMAFDRLLRHRNLWRLVTISRSISVEMARTSPQLASRLCVAPSGADIASDTSGYADPFGGDTSRLRVGYVGNLYPGKGMELIAPLVRAAAWADFHIIGGMESDIALWRSELQDAANVTFHGFKANAELPVYYSYLDVFLAPYQRDVRGVDGKDDLSNWMSPMKLFEYMAYAKPILCSDLPVLKEIVTHGQDALLCSPDDVADWANALQRVRDDREFGSSLGATAKKLLLEKYTWDARARNVLEGL